MQWVGKSSQQIDVINVVVSDSDDDDLIAPRTTKSIIDMSELSSVENDYDLIELYVA